MSAIFAFVPQIQKWNCDTCEGTLILILWIMTSGYTPCLICYKKPKKQKKNKKESEKPKKNPLNHHCLIQCQVASLEQKCEQREIFVSINITIVNQSIRQSLVLLFNQESNNDYQQLRSSHIFCSLLSTAIQIIW